MNITDEVVDRAVVFYTSGISFISMKDAQAWYDRLPDKPLSVEDFSDTKDLHRFAMRAALTAALGDVPFPVYPGDRDALREHIFQKDEYTEDQKRELYRIADAIQVRVLANYPELHEIGDRPKAWAYPAMILLGMVPPAVRAAVANAKGGDQ